MAVRGALMSAVKNAGVAHEPLIADAGIARAHMTEHSIIGAYDALRHLARSGGTLRDAIENTVRYAGLVVDDAAPITLFERGEVATVRLCIASHGERWTSLSPTEFRARQTRSL